MGEKTRSMIGTMDGVATVYVDSANPKTADGYNAFVFHRDVDRSLRKLAWLPAIDAVNNPLPKDISVGDLDVRYGKEQKRALTHFVVERSRLQYGTMVNDDFGSFAVNSTFSNEIQRHAIGTMRELAAVSSAREIAVNMVHIAGSPNEVTGEKKAVKFFEYGLAKIRLGDGLYIVLGILGVGVNSRRYYDQHVAAKFKVDSEVASLQGRPRIGESTFDEVYDSRFRLLLQALDLYYLQKNMEFSFGCLLLLVSSLTHC